MTDVFWRVESVPHPWKGRGTRAVERLLQEGAQAGIVPAVDKIDFIG